MDVLNLIALTEKQLPSYKELGYLYVAVYRLIDHDMAFIDAYRTWEDYARNRKYWMANNYVVRKMYDLDYADYIKEQNV